jgi:hypothetical protein
MEEVGRQNMAMMERAFSMFAPFHRPDENTPPGAPQPGAGAASEADAAGRPRAGQLERGRGSPAAKPAERSASTCGLTNWPASKQPCSSPASL